MDITYSESMLTLPVQRGRDHILGPLDAPLTLVEYGDYECPVCASAQPVVKAVRLSLGDDLRFVFRHFPLASVHPHAQIAAEAAEAAALQGRFWAMHDILFESQDVLEPEDLASYADELGLDTDRFIVDVSSHACALKVREDFMSGVRSGVNGTPTFFVNDRRLDGAWDYVHLLAALERARR